MSEWLAMGGYGAYVWPAYGIACTILLAIVVHGRLRERRLLGKLERRTRA